MSRYFRWVISALGLILDALVSLIGTFVFFNPNDRLFGFIAIFVGLIIIPNLVLIWELIKALLLFWWPAKKLMVREYLRVFRSGKFPDGDGVYDLDHYLATLIDDKEADIAVRLKAAHLAGQLSGLRVGRPLAVGMTNYIAAEAALHKYQDEAVKPWT